MMQRKAPFAINAAMDLRKFSNQAMEPTANAAAHRNLLMQTAIQKIKRQEE
jgi:hypothetical protein